MMCPVLLFLVLFFLACSYLLFAHLFRPSPRSVVDVIAIVRRVEEGELEDLFDELKDENLRTNLPAARFQDEQRRRARLLFEYLRRMSFNSLAVLAWAYAEQERLHGPGMHEDQAQARRVHDLIQAGTECRVYCVVAISKLACRLLLAAFRIASIRTLTTMRHAGSIDGLNAYRRLANAVASLNAADDGNLTRILAALLHGSDSTF